MIVFCLAEVSLFCFDQSVVTLYKRASAFPLLSVFSLYHRFASYCENRISSHNNKNDNNKDNNDNNKDNVLNINFI